MLPKWCNNWALQTREVASAVAEDRAEVPVPEQCADYAIDRTRLTPLNSGLMSFEQLDHLSKTTPGWLTTAIRQSNANWSEANYLMLLSLSQHTPFSPGFVPRDPIDVLVTDHSRGSSVLEADWGCGLDSPVAYREPYLRRNPPAGEVTTMPKCKNGDLEVMISAEKVVIDRLKQDVDLIMRSDLNLRRREETQRLKCKWVGLDGSWSLSRHLISAANSGTMLLYQYHETQQQGLPFCATSAS